MAIVSYQDLTTFHSSNSDRVLIQSSYHSAYMIVRAMQLVNPGCPLRHDAHKKGTRIVASKIRKFGSWFSAVVKYKAITSAARIPPMICPTGNGSQSANRYSPAMRLDRWAHVVEPAPMVWPRRKVPDGRDLRSGY
jgi:hypothetical protein